METEVDRVLDALPTELVLAQAREAHRDAHNVGLFLSGFFAALGHPLKGINQFPAAFLLELAAALRLLLWQSHGLVREWMGLPSAEQALSKVLLNCEAPDPELPLSKLVSRTYSEHFTWAGPEVIGADIVLPECDQKALANAIGEFLWKNRHSSQKALTHEP